MIRCDLAIVGAGPTALGSLHRFGELKAEGRIGSHTRVLLIEREAEPGGLARSVVDSKGFCWDLGVHVTGASRFPTFLRILSETIPQWNVVPRCVQADVSHIIGETKKSRYVPYPVQNSVHHFPKEIRDQILSELEEIAIREAEPECSNFAEFAQIHFGETLRSVFIRPYNEKIWIRNRETAEEKRIQFELLISTIPLTELGRLSGLFNDLKLRFSKVLLVGIGLKRPQNDFASTLSWAYYPQPEICFYRCTVLSNFSESLTPNPQKFWSVLCEIGRRPEDQQNPEEIIQKVIKGFRFLTKEYSIDIQTVGLIEGREQIHSTWFHIIPHGYPIPSLERESELRRCHSILESFQIFSRGRFGSWKYETSNQDYCFEMGRGIVDRLFLDSDEPLL